MPRVVRGADMRGCSIYVGNLPPFVRAKDVQDLFGRFGHILNLDLKTKRGPPFAFVQFEDPRDAEDAQRARHNFDFDGYKIRVEFPKSGDDLQQQQTAKKPERTPARRSQFRVKATGLPRSGSWQDLKDHMRDAGDVCFTDVRDCEGVVEYIRYEDMKYAVTKLDDTRFRSHEGETSYIRVREDRMAGFEQRERSRSPSNRTRS